MRRFRGVLLDVDGTLIDSVEAHAQAWHEAFCAAGLAVRTLQIRRLIGMGGDQLVRALTRIEPGSREYKRLTAHRDELFREHYLARVRPIVGARAFVLRLRAEGYHVVIASSSGKQDLGHLLEIADVEDLIEARVCAGEVEHTKPSPDPIEAALAKLPVGRHQAVMIGDSPYDIDAARQANVATIGVGTGGFVSSDLAGAIAVYPSVGELVTRWADSPLA